VTIRPSNGTSVEHASYDALADEYYDPVAHPTCYNLNRLSRLFISRNILEPWDGRETIDVGAGDSCVAAVLHARGYSLNGLLVTDVSERMLRHSRSWAQRGATLAICDARDFSRCAGVVSLLVASLGDPYNTPDFWSEAHRGVRPGGRVLFTMPSYEWSARFRGTKEGSQIAEFVLRNGQRVDVASYVMPLHEQVRLMQGAGFMISSFDSLGADHLHADELRSPKIDVFRNDKSSLVWGFELIRLAHPIGVPS
jgi:SAM-dependent methyltransferase